MTPEGELTDLSLLITAPIDLGCPAYWAATQPVCAGPMLQWDLRLYISRIPCFPRHKGLRNGASQYEKYLTLKYFRNPILSFLTYSRMKYIYSVTEFRDKFPHLAQAKCCMQIKQLV